MNERLRVVVSLLAPLFCIGCSARATAQQDPQERASDGSAARSEAPVAEAFGKPIYDSNSDESAEFVLAQRLMIAYLTEHHLSASEQDLDAALAAVAARLEAEGRTGDLELMKKQNAESSGQKRASMRAEMDRWRFLKALYDEYGGRVCLSPLDPGAQFFPVDAYVQLLKKQEANKSVRFLDPGFRERLYKSYETFDPRYSRGLEEMAKLYFAKPMCFWTKADEERISRLMLEWMQKLNASDQPPTDTAEDTSDDMDREDDSAKRPADGGKEPPPEEDFPARSFNSRLKLAIVVQESPTSEPVEIGSTPSAAPVQIPACWCWWVSPREPGKDGEVLEREIDQNRVPGVSLRGCADSDLAILASVTDLRVLEAVSNSITDAGLAHLQGLTNLRYLSLDNADVTDAGLAHLKDLTRLQYFMSYSEDITNAGLAHLRGLTNLRYLGLDNAQVTNAGLAHLRGLADLRHLSLGNARITDAGLAHLRRMTRLQHLHVGNAGGVTDVGLAHLKDMTDMRSLWLFYALVTDAGMVHLKGMTHLEEVHWSSPGITNVGLAHLKDLTQMRELDVSHARITDDGLAYLKGMTKLRSLDLFWTNDLTGAGLTHLTGLTQLRDLTLSSDRLTTAGLANLGKLTGLRSLRLSGRNITDAATPHLTGLTALEELDLGYSNITDAAMAHLTGLTSLRRLVLRYTNITDGGLRYLSPLKGLQEVDLTNTQVTPEGVGKLKEALPRVHVSK